MYHIQSLLSINIPVHDYNFNLLPNRAGVGCCMSLDNNKNIFIHTSLSIMPYFPDGKDEVINIMISLVCVYYINHILGDLSLTRFGIFRVLVF